MGILLCQISTRLIEQRQSDDPLATSYYDRLWERRKEEGFLRPDDFWELPPWIALLKKNIPEAEVMVIRNVQEFLDHIHFHDYSYICFSVLDANKEIIKEIISQYHGNATFAVGGYIDLEHYFIGYDTVSTFRSISHFSEHVMGRYEEEYDYSPFENWSCIPRLVLSSGCTNRCSFCTVENALKLKSWDVVRSQVKSFEKLNFELVYVGDKTFGQASNHMWLPKLRRKLEEINPAFRGFIIQTTATQFLKLPEDFIEKAGIRFVEIGVETFNDPILRVYHKPTTVDQILEATTRFRDLEACAVPNIIIGMPEETIETYKNTLNYLEEFEDVMSHFGICNLAIYDNTELGQKMARHQKSFCDYNELTVHKSFHKDEEQAHEWFHDKLFKLGLKMLG